MSAPPETTLSPREEMIDILLLFLLGALIFVNQRENIYEIATKFYHSYLDPYIGLGLPIIGLVLKFLTVCFIAGIIFLTVKLRNISSVQWVFYKPLETESSFELEHKTKWEVILDHANSDNQAEWKLAIIEADNVLDELLKEIGYGGETLGDRLQSLDGSTFRTLSGAWEAHKLRNTIAHEQGLELSRRDAKKAIKLYEDTFRELGYFGSA